MRLRFHCSLLSISVLLGCSEYEPSPNQNSVEQAGLKLSTALEQSADVRGIRFEVAPVDCSTGISSGAPFLAENELLPLTIPGGSAELAGAPLDSGSAHFFADGFLTVPAGCYDVTSTPITATGGLSALCSAARKKGVVVMEGKTTEVFMINQCSGTDRGNVDVISALNHEPSIVAVEFEKSKFLSCNEPQVICATASDPDRDPLAFVWNVAPSLGAPKVLSNTFDPKSGTAKECVEVVARREGRHAITLTVYDQLWVGGSLVNIESFLAAEGYPHASHASNDFFFYAVDCERCVDSTDVVLFHDLSGSFYYNIARVKAQAPTLFDKLTSAAPDSRLGVASFVDKPFGPFGSIGDYVFRIEAEGQLTADRATFLRAMNGMIVRSGADYPEAQIEGLMHIGTHAAELGYRPGAKKYVVMMTDATFHQAGECIARGYCTEMNDGDHTIETTEDYPQIPQIASVLASADITPIFVVTSSVVPTYQALMSELTSLGVRPGKVLTLASDASNLLDAVLDGLECPAMAK